MQVGKRLPSSTKRTANRIGSRLVDLLVLTYQSFLSPYLGGNCRFEPSCSVYCRQCYSELGFWQASYYSLRRLLSCHPFGRSGYDPVPRRGC